MVGPGRQERSWIRGARAGSVSDLEALFREHWPRAHRAAYLVVQDAAAAEDIAQEAFLSALRNLDRFDRRRPFGPWLHRIVVNRAIDWARGPRAAPRAVRGPGSEDFDTGDLGTFSEGVAAGLASLPPDQRAVIVLRYLLEYTPGRDRRTCSICRAGRSTRACAAASTGSRRSSTGSSGERRRQAGAPADPGAGRDRRAAPGLGARPRIVRRPRAGLVAAPEPPAAPRRRPRARRRCSPRSSRRPGERSSAACATRSRPTSTLRSRSPR